MNHPKRRKANDNPYELIVFDNNYLIKFKDGKDHTQIVEIDPLIYKAFNKFELEDISQMHKYERHIEHSIIYDNNLYMRSFNKQSSLEDKVINKIINEQLKIALKSLSENQYRRIKMYYFNDMTLQEISEIEKCSIHSIFVSINRSKEKLKKILNQV